MYYILRTVYHVLCTMFYVQAEGDSSAITEIDQQREMSDPSQLPVNSFMQPTLKSFIRGMLSRIRIHLESEADQV